jgi:hypothetical protein
MFGIIKKFRQQWAGLNSKVNYLYSRHGQYDLQTEKFLLGRMMAQFNKQRTIDNIRDAEFQVFSQFGDDGIIQYLVDNVDGISETFIEFGVENYLESNTRFLLLNNNWSGLVMDGSKQNIEFISQDPISRMHDLHAVHAFVTRENINALLEDFTGKGFSHQVGILSIDIDGNDFWIWDAITAVDPTIVIIEYNAVFGARPWVIPYDEKFYRMAHGSHQYWGASLKAFEMLGTKKGFALVGCNAAGNNAYFVKTSNLGKIKSLSFADAFVLSKFREDQINGQRIGGQQRFELLKGKPIYNTMTNKQEII